MDKVIEAARALGRALQADERYIKYNVIQQQNDEDEGLQKIIAEFTGKREELQNELQKQERDNELVGRLNEEVKEMYSKIFEHPNMVVFASAREELQSLITFVNQIVTGSSSGEDPDTIEYQESCGGSCSSCSGCG